jgi:hypothetical protein
MTTPRDTICDYCHRPFSYSGPAICMNCGIENVRLDVPAQRTHLDANVERASAGMRIPETAMLVPAVEKAVMPRPLPKTPGKRGRPKRK